MFQTVWVWGKFPAVSKQSLEAGDAWVLVTCSVIKTDGVCQAGLHLQLPINSLLQLHEKAAQIVSFNRNAALLHLCLPYTCFFALHINTSSLNHILSQSWSVWSALDHTPCRPTPAHHSTRRQSKCFCWGILIIVSFCGHAYLPY
jgi:hypothetical protein